VFDDLLRIRDHNRRLFLRRAVAAAPNLFQASIAENDF
jgi:hypothetical protein